MLKPTHTESDYTAKYLGHRVHEGSGCKKSRRKRSEKRGRKSKKGRVVRQFKITLLPNDLQKEYLERDLKFFNEVYAYTMSKLSEEFPLSKEGYYHGYDVKNCRATIAQRRSKYLVPHTPKYIMHSQNALIKESDWMRACTYQVSYRATLHAFMDKIRKEFDREFSIDGNTYEAKICYRVINGFLYLKKFDQMIEIKETLPKGGLESIRITKEGNNWTAVIEILEPHDKAEDIRESRKGVLETDTKEAPLNVTEGQSRFLDDKAKLFNSMTNYDIVGSSPGESLMDKMKYYQSIHKAEKGDIGILNMACVAANARIFKYRNQKLTPKVSKNYIALSEGFFIKDGILHLKRWGLELPIIGIFSKAKYFDYIILKKTEDGIWTISGKKRKRKIFRNLSRLVREFSWKDRMIF